ncbi:MAG: tyrosine-type recombinase/integrase [Acidobacteriota bacterium]
MRRRAAPGKANAVDVFAAVRMFLRYLAVEGRCRAGLEQALPRLASWSQRRLPHVLPVENVERLIASCDPTSKVGLRDRAILLLLARLGLRAGDVAGLRLDDLCWEKASLRIVGKGGREALLPVPQDVGDAILAYLERGRPATGSDYVFLRGLAPFRPLASGGAISLVVRRALGRAGVESPSRGSHLLRHSLASRLLREGAPLRGIAEVLRHKSVKTTIIYAKVDVDLLARVAEPWPEVSR